jgi:hypothetical protein
MGIPVGLIPVPGKVITEIEAIDILSGAEAVPVAAGGLGGAEGSTTLVLQGLEEKVNRALQIIPNNRVRSIMLDSLYRSFRILLTYVKCNPRWSATAR